MPNFASQILEQSRERIQKRMDEQMASDTDLRNTQTKMLLDSIFAQDENGNFKLDDVAADDAWAKIQALHKHNPGIKNVLMKAADVMKKIKGVISPPSAMVDRAKGDVMSQLGQPGTGTTPPFQPQQATTPLAPQDALAPRISNEATTNPMNQLLPPSRRNPIEPQAQPPARMSEVQLYRAGAKPNPIQVEKAKEERAYKRETEKEATQHKYRLEEIEAGKKDVMDKEIDTFTDADGYRVTTYQRPNGTTYEAKSTVKAKPDRVPGQGNVQDVEVEWKSGGRGMAIFHPDPDSPNVGKYTDPETGKDVTANVKGIYHQPAASIQLMQAGEDSVQAWVDMAKTGQVKSLTEVPTFQRNAVAKAMREQSVRFEPPSIRERRVAIQSAKTFIAPLEGLVGRINAAPTLQQKIELSYLLDSYTNSISTLLARSLGERGMATEGDVQRASGLAPGWKAANFNPDYAIQELNWLKGIMTGQEQSIEAYFRDSTQPGRETTAPVTPKPATAPAANPYRKEAPLAPVRAQRRPGG